MNMPFTEKSAWISLVVIIYIWGQYALDVIGLHSNPISMEDKEAIALSMISTALIAVIIAESAFHIILAMAHPDEDEQAGDERDKQINLIATKPAYAALFVGTIFAIGHLQMGAYFPQMIENSSLQIPFISIHILIFSALIAEIIRFAVMIKEYRLGV